MKITYAVADNWKGLYINGNLMLEGVELNPIDIIEAIAYKTGPSLNIELETKYVEKIKSSFKERLPLKEEKVKWEK